nr:hypothetical protein Iba_chr04cCG9450 [Ipomoea batatas]
MKEAMRKTIAVSSDFRESGGVERGTIVDLVVLVVKEVVGDGEDGLGDLQRMSMGEYPDKEWTKDFDREREWKEWKEKVSARDSVFWQLEKRPEGQNQAYYFNNIQDGENHLITCKTTQYFAIQGDNRSLISSERERPIGFSSQIVALWVCLVTRQRKRKGRNRTTHIAPPAAGPMALKRDIADIEMPLAAPLCSWDWNSASRLNPTLENEKKNTHLGD